MVKECVHIDTGKYYAAKVINKRMMAGREHMVGDGPGDRWIYWGESAPAVESIRLMAIIGAK